MSKGGERNLRTRGGVHIDPVERIEVALECRQDLHDHVIAAELGEILSDLPLAEGVVDCIVNELRIDAVARGLIAVDRQRQRRPRGLLIRGDIA